MAGGGENAGDRCGKDLKSLGAGVELPLAH